MKKSKLVSIVIAISIVLFFSSCTNDELVCPEEDYLRNQLSQGLLDSMAMHFDYMDSLMNFEQYINLSNPFNSYGELHNNCMDYFNDNYTGGTYELVSPDSVNAVMPQFFVDSLGVSLHAAQEAFFWEDTVNTEDMRNLLMSTNPSSYSVLTQVESIMDDYIDSTFIAENECFFDSIMSNLCTLETNLLAVTDPDTSALMTVTIAKYSCYYWLHAYLATPYAPGYNAYEYWASNPPSIRTSFGSEKNTVTLQGIYRMGPEPTAEDIKLAKKLVKRDLEPAGWGGFATGVKALVTLSMAGVGSNAVTAIIVAAAKSIYDEVKDGEDE